MLQQDEAVQTLVDLGLTVLQAKVYMALAKSGTSAGRTTAKAAKVASQDVYRVLSELQEKGLVEKIIAKPALYKATPLKDGVSILLQKRKEKEAELQKKTSSLLSNFRDNDLQDFPGDNQQFKISSELTLVLKMHERLIQSAQTSVDIIMPEKILHTMLFYHNSFLEKSKKDTRIRIIVQRVDEKTSVRKLQALAKNAFTEIRYSHNTALFGMHIFDKKEVTLCISEKDHLPSLWSNDYNLVQLAQAYFENIWSAAEFIEEAIVNNT